MSKKQRRKRYSKEGLFRNSKSADRKYNEMISKAKINLRNIHP